MTRRFGGVRAVNGFDVALSEGEVQGLIGPNGAGKSTVVNLITGSLALSGGDVLLDRRSIKRWSPQRIARAGVVRTHQTCRIFRDQTVVDNVSTGVIQRHLTKHGAILRLPYWLGSSRLYRKAALDLVDRFGLADFADRTAGTLPFGTQRRVELARAVATEPRFLLLDEPAAGMNDVEAAELGATLRTLAAAGIGILLIEHHTQLVFDVCTTVTVLDFGEVIECGTPGVVRNSDKVQLAYLGHRNAAG